MKTLIGLVVLGAVVSAVVLLNNATRGKDGKSVLNVAGEPEITVDAARPEQRDVLDRAEWARRAAEDAPEEERGHERQHEERARDERQRVGTVAERERHVLHAPDGADAPEPVEAEVEEREDREDPHLPPRPLPEHEPGGERHHAGEDRDVEGSEIFRTRLRQEDPRRPVSRRELGRRLAALLLGEGDR